MTYGHPREYGIEKITRALRAHQILKGTDAIMRLIFACCLVKAP